MGNRRKIDRSEQARHAASWARRTLLVLARICAAVLALTALGAGARGAYLFLTTSPRFAIATFELSGLERVSEAEVRRRLGIAEGDNLFRADVRAAADALRTLPWVREARVERRFPQGILVELLERHAVALVDLQNLYLLDEQGEVFKRALPEDPADLPLITGLSREEWVDRPEQAKARLSEAVRILEAFAQSDVAKVKDAAELHLEASGGFTLFLGEEALAVRLGREGTERKLARLSRVLDELARRGERAEVIHLDNRARPGWIAARLAEPETAAATARKGRTAAP